MNELFLSANRMLTERWPWEAKQRLFYRMRHDGLPRISKPFPTAADGHDPVIDKAIRKQKPFYAGQTIAGDRVCNFISIHKGGQLDATTDAAASYYDFETNQRTDFLDEMEVCRDYMLLTGRGVMKCTIDPMNENRLVDEAVNPYFILMPQKAHDFEDADEFVHVREFSVAKYLRLDNRYLKDPATMDRIKGSPDFQSLGIWNQDVRLREGINYSADPRAVIIFEHYSKTGGGWTVDTYCPQAPDIKLRQSYGVPYKINGKVSVPFFSFPLEIKDKGWYSPRGLGELLAPWEQYSTKLLNEKADCITFANRPLFTGEKEIVNAANYRFNPGEFIPGNITSVQMHPPAIDYNEEMMYAKSQAEEISQSPDFGIQQGGPTGGKPRTATENDRIAALSQAGTVYQGTFFRRRLTKMHKHRWGLIVQFRARELSYYVAGETNTLTDQALHNDYLISPDGSPDAWNPMARFQKAMTAVQAFAGNPNVDPEPLTKEALTAWDGRMAQKAFIPTNMKGASEYQDQVALIGAVLCPGGNRPAIAIQVNANEDHVTRLKANIDWIHAATVMGTPIDPVSKQRLHDNITQHLAMLKQQNPAAAKQIAGMLQQLEQASQSLGATAQSTQGQPTQTNTHPGMTPGSQVAGQPAAGAPGVQPGKESVVIAYKDAPPDIQRQMEAKAGFKPSTIGEQPPEPGPIPGAPRIATMPAPPLPQ
jgi:hypothetical protein